VVKNTLLCLNLGEISGIIYLTILNMQSPLETTNIIESVHRQFRTLTKTKGAFPNDNSLLKLLFAGIQNAEKKWTMPIRNWSLTLSLSLIFILKIG